MNKNTFLVAVVFLVLGVLLGCLLSKDKHLSWMQFCQKTAQDYLQNYVAPEYKNNGVVWNRAVDVETDMYNLCISNLTDSSLNDFKSVVIEKYNND